MTLKLDASTGKWIDDGIIADSSGDEKPSLVPVDLSAIDSMDIDGLKNLIRKVYSAIWGIKAISGAELIKNAVASDNELYEALMLKGITLALNASEWREFNALATFWAERKKGKPSQSIDLNAKIGIVDIVLEAARQRKEIESPLIEADTIP